MAYTFARPWTHFQDQNLTKNYNIGRILCTEFQLPLEASGVSANQSLNRYPQLYTSLGMFLWWSLCFVYLLTCQASYNRQLWSLVCSCDIFQGLINSLCLLIVHLLSCLRPVRVKICLLHQRSAFFSDMECMASRLGKCTLGTCCLGCICTVQTCLVLLLSNCFCFSVIIHVKVWSNWCMVYSVFQLYILY